MEDEELELPDVAGAFVEYVLVEPVPVLELLAADPDVAGTWFSATCVDEVDPSFAV